MSFVITTTMQVSALSDILLTNTPLISPPKGIVKPLLPNLRIILVPCPTKRPGDVYFKFFFTPVIPEERFTTVLKSTEVGKMMGAWEPWFLPPHKY